MNADFDKFISRFATIPACDERTDGQTNAQTDGRIANIALAFINAGAR